MNKIILRYDLSRINELYSMLDEYVCLFLRRCIAVSLAGLVVVLALPGLAKALGPSDGIVLPASAILITPGSHAQSIVEAHPPGSAFVFGPGVHRLQQIFPRRSDSFFGAPGARLNGSVVLTDASRLGGRYVFDGPAPHRNMERHGVCQSAYPLCDRPLALFLDDQPLRVVGSVEEVVSGSWFFDEQRHRIYLADDPAGRVAEITHTPFAFGGDAQDVTIENLTIEKYASSNQQGAINGRGAGVGWTVRHNDVLRNYGYGIAMGARNRAIGNRAMYNGQIGIGGGSAAGMLVEGNEIAFNVWNGVNCEWECGGGKWGEVTDLVLRGNHVHHNDGLGLWTDDWCSGVVFADNLIERNARAGISHEISQRAVIRNNRLIGNGTGGFAWGWHAQIQIQNSQDVEVYGNHIELDPVAGGNGITLIQQDRGAGLGLRNIAVTGNVLVMAGGGGTLAGWFADFEAERVAGSSIRFESNEYVVPSLPSPIRAWSMDRPLLFQQWQAAGFDAHGTIRAMRP